MRAAQSAALLPTSTFGLGIALPDQDAFATARGNAFVATADDPAAIFYNPAGITAIGRFLNTSLGAYGIVYQLHYTKATAPPLTAKTKPTWPVLPQVFYNAQHSEIFIVTLGVGTYSPYGLREMEWPINSPRPPPIGETGQIQLLHCSIPFVAYNPDLRHSLNRRRSNA